MLRGMKPAYAANTAKAVETILWFANRQPGIDVYRIVKAAYYADKQHINAYGRPICGDMYFAAPYGPLARVLYGILKSDPLEMIALGGNGELPFEIKGRYNVYPLRDFNFRKLSRTDIEALEYGYNAVANKSFEAILRETHADPAYARAEGTYMDYRDFLDSDDPRYPERARYIEETASSAVL